MTTEVRAQLSSLQEAVVALATRVDSVDVRAYESLTSDRLALELRPIVSELLRLANDLVDAILRMSDSESHHAIATPTASTLTTHPSAGFGIDAPYVPFERAIDAALDTQRSTSIRAVGDIAFLAHLELRQRAERLERVSTCESALAIVGECDSALRRIRKALTSIDVAFGRTGLIESQLDFASELDVSLRVRRACAKFRMRVLTTGGEPTPEDIYIRMRRAGTAIAMLVGWEIYPFIRVRDRLQLRELQRRILDWIRGDRVFMVGAHLWEDLVGFIRMLGQMSRRQELVAHDASVIRRALVVLRGASPADETVPETTLQELLTLEGLDEELDRLIASDQRNHIHAWLPALEPLASALNRSEQEHVL